MTKEVTTETTKKPKGFAALSPEKRKEIGSKGGKAAHLLGKAHQWTQEEAKRFGRLGGTAPRPNRGKKKEDAENAPSDV